MAVLHPAETRRFYPRRFAAWRANGLSARAAGAAALAGCDSIEDIARLGRSYFQSLPNLGEKSLKQLADLAGWPPKRHTVVDAIAAALLLAISDPEEAREVAVDVATALRRSGFILIAERGQS